MAELRIGKVSAIDYDKGKISVYYPDRSGCVTDFLPSLARNGYLMPKIGDEVAVLHEDSVLGGLVLGTVWNGRKLPAESGEDIAYKELSEERAYIRYNDSTGVLTIKAPVIELEQEEVNE